MPIPIPITGLAANDAVPDNYIEINFAQGPSSSGQSVYAVVLVGNKTSAGDATVDTVVYGGPTSPLNLQTEVDFIARFGAGSELHRMARRFLAVNTITPLYAIAVLESTGAAATGTVTFTGTATANSNVRTFVGDDFVDTAVVIGDTPAVIAANVAASINSKSFWGVTASSAAGVMTITAKQKGPRGNWIRYASVVTTSGSGVASSVPANTFMTGGTTADSNANALATLSTTRYYYTVSAAEDATQFGAAVAQANTLSGPLVKLRSRVVAGSVDTSGNVTAIATGINAARGETVWLQNADQTPSELAAYTTGFYALAEASATPLVNFDGVGATQFQKVFNLAAPRGVAPPSRNTIKAALNNGITPLGIIRGGAFIVSRITTRSLSGATPDYRVRDAHKVTVMDFYADDLEAKIGQQFAGKKIADDPKLGDRALPPDVLTPRAMRAAVNQLTSEYGDKYLFQNTDQIIAGTIVQRETSPSTRMSTRVPAQVIDVDHQNAFALDQVN